MIALVEPLAVVAARWRPFRRVSVAQEKRCPSCGITKPRVEFSLGQGYCKPCNRTRAREWQLAHPEQHRRQDREAKRRRQRTRRDAMPPVTCAAEGCGRVVSNQKRADSRFCDARCRKVAQKRRTALDAAARARARYRTDPDYRERRKAAAATSWAKRQSLRECNCGVDGTLAEVSEHIARMKALPHNENSDYHGVSEAVSA